MRKLLGVTALFAFLAAYVVIIVSLGSRMAYAHWALQLVFYVVAGVAWALPLKPLMRWMHAKDSSLPPNDI
ncbi:MAG: DUF2842 domain-containing protein [Pseudomonadota bacterium]